MGTASASTAPGGRRALTFDRRARRRSAPAAARWPLSVEDNGAMAAVFAPLDEIEQIVAEVDGYVVIANVNSTARR